MIVLIYKIIKHYNMKIMNFFILKYSNVQIKKFQLNSEIIIRQINVGTIKKAFVEGNLNAISHMET